MTSFGVTTRLTLTAASSCRRGRIADAADRGQREQHDGGHCTDEGDAKRACAGATTIISDTRLETVDELG